MHHERLDLQLLGSLIMTLSLAPPTRASRSAGAFKPLEDDRLFPFTASNASLMVQNTLDRMGLNGKDSATLRYLFHPPRHEEMIS